MANAPGLRFTDGTTTVTVSDGTTGWLVKYEAKNKRASDPEVTEQATTLLIGGISAVRTTVESLNKLFQQAETRRNTGVGTRVFVERLTEASGSWWRSELVEALPVLEASGMDWGLVQGKFEVSLIFTRKNWWEGAETQISLSNPCVEAATTSAVRVNFPRMYVAAAYLISFDSATKRISAAGIGLEYFLTGQTIKVFGSTSNDGTYTIADGGNATYITVNESLVTESAGTATKYILGARSNYVDVDASSVLGDLPAPTKLEITTDYGGAYYSDLVIAGLNTSNPANMYTLLEAEDRSSGGTISTDYTGTSYGQYTAHSVSAGTEADLLKFSLATHYGAGSYFLPILRFKTFADIFYAIKIMSGTATLYQSAWQRIEDYSETTKLVGTLKPVRFPPRAEMLVSSSTNQFDFYLVAKNASGSSATIHMDYIGLIPLDSHVQMKRLTNGVQIDKWIANAIEHEFYTIDGATYDVNLMVYGNGIYLKPGVAQRLVFEIMDFTSGEIHNVSRYHTIKLYYRPRKLTLN